MDYKVVVTAEAEEDLNQFIQYLLFAKKNKQAAKNVLDDFENTIKKLKYVADSLIVCGNPRLQSLGYRRINFQQHRYFMLYRIENDVVYGATVMYGSASELRATLEYVFSQEKDFSYKGLSMDEIIHHLAVFVSRLWQIHIFGEGNTRTTAVFFIKYLKTLGLSATNDIFAENAWYFRNALVRANYTNLQKGIHETTEYLEAFLRNLLLNEKNELHNRNLHISGLLNEEKVDIGDTKVDIENGKVDIQDEKVDIESVLSEKSSDFSVKTTIHIHRLFEKFGFDEVFGRSAVMELLELKGSGASKLLSNLVQADIIEPVSGHGKGKYKFKK